MEVYFSNDYDKNNFVLIESNPHLLEAIEKNDNMIIKGTTKSILCTSSKSFELKYLDSSNSFLLLEEEAPNKQNIKTLTQHTLECIDIVPRKISLLKKLIDNKLAYDFVTHESNFNDLKKYSIEMLANETELCEKDFQSALQSFGVVMKNGYAFMLDEAFLLEMIRKLLDILVEKRGDIESTLINSSLLFLYLQNSENEMIKLVDQLSTEEKNHIMLHFCDTTDIEEFYCLNPEKVKWFCTQTVFFKMDSIKLNDFVKMLKEIYRQVFTSEQYIKIEEEDINYSQSSCQDNLFEYYRDADLRFLKGKATIYFTGMHKDPLIRLVQNHELSETFDQRLKDLYKLKDKWPISEIKQYFKEFTSFEEKMDRFCKIVTKENPFNKDSKISYYMLKFKID